MNINRWVAAWGFMALGIAAGITMSVGALFPNQKEYGLLVILVVLAAFGFLGRQFINRQVKTG